MGLSLELKIIFFSHSKVVDITSVELLSQSGSACSHSDSEDSADCKDILQAAVGSHVNTANITERPGYSTSYWT